MGRLSDRLKEYVALIKLMKPLGILRLEILSGYSFIVTMVVGIISHSISIPFILLSALTIIVVVGLIVLHVLSGGIK